MNMLHTRASSLTRRRAAGLFAGAAGGLVAACRGALLGSQNQGETVALKKGVTLRYHHRAGPEDEMLAKRLPAFEETYGIKVQQEATTGDFVAVINTLIAAGTLGDVIHTHPSAAQPHRMFLSGAAIGLDELVKRDKIDLRQWFQQAINGLRVNGTLTALPYKGKMGRIAFFYNATMYKEAGLKLPDLNYTIEQLTEDAQKLTRRTGDEVRQWGIGGHLESSQTTFDSILRRWGMELFTSDQKRTNLLSPNHLQAFQWHYDIYHRMRVADPRGNMTQLFTSGKVATLFNLDFNTKTTIHAAVGNAFEWSATLAPKGPTGRRGGIFIPDSMSISATSPNRNEAWKLALWLCDKESGLALALQSTGSTTPGARPDVYADPRFLEHPVYPRILQELDKMATELPEDFVVPWNFRLPEIQAVITKYVQQIRNNEAEPSASFMRQLHDEIQRELDMPIQ
jgi:ABC-type glycerol-3-phosphate transport system substrate-binding protein